MSLENAVQILLERKSESQKKAKISYTRDELLSFSNFCKKLPSGFDVSILSEFDEASISINERQRGFAGLTFQSAKRSDHGSPPPNRSEGAGGFSRGGFGRWDIRSSGSNNNNGDLQSSREAHIQDTGRRFGIQSRRFAQHTEHDGLLGRPSGYAGLSAAKARATSQFHLTKASEPYQPPRPYKAVAFQRKDDKDSCNDETFGSNNCSSEDKAEEEQRRRASFESMRKEQQKSLQEKQRQISDNHKENVDADIIALLKNSVDKKSVISKTDKAADSSHPQNESPRASIMHASLCRPLVPPGFASTAVDKNLPVQSSSSCFASEETSTDNMEKQRTGGTDDDQEKRHQSTLSLQTLQKDMLKNDSISDFLENDNDKLAISPSSVKDFKPPVISDKISCLASGLQKVDNVWEEVIENDACKNEKEKNEVSNSLMQHSSVSILEKLLGASLLKTSASSISSVNQGFETDKEEWIPSISDTSKFANWFVEEEKPVEDLSKDLLSLILNNEKVGSSASVPSCGKAIGQIEPNLTLKKNESTQKFGTSPAADLIAGTPEQYHQVDKSDSTPVPLTCEDLEQSILADIEGTSTMQHGAQDPRTRIDGKMEQQKSNSNDHASQHLLSLLQKGTKKEESVSVTSSSLDIELFEISVTDNDYSSNLGISENTTHVFETKCSSENTLRLETLLGVSFMKELQSAQAPVSTQRVPDSGANAMVLPTSVGFPFPNSDASFFSSSSGDHQPNMTIQEKNSVTSNHIHDANLRYILGPDKEHENSFVEEQKLGVAGSGIGVGNHTEAFQRLMEMEMRANAKHVRPAAVGHIPCTYDPEFGMNFRYR
ncbi:hypothetical protein Cni_G22025 [Canna indica]|uniref:Uncharacterized protein n=1 Tax=Canna indica TaxID=4628 RepID=A0AAQ3KW19_9LILI|nr:hypothetical protein Cni_G22025 [Canna indica]